MNNIEEKLNKIKTRLLSEEEKDSLWHKLVVVRLEEERNPKRLSFNVFNFRMKKIVTGVMVLLVILGGTGVAAASNSVMPGDLLFSVDLALEKAQIKLVSQNKKIELKRRFAHERVSEVKSLMEKRSSKDVANAVVFSARENDDVGVALTNINEFLAEDEDVQDKEELRKNFNDLLVVLGDDKNMKIEKKSGEIKIKSDEGEVEIKLKDRNNHDGGKGSNSSDSTTIKKSDDRSGRDLNDDSKISNSKNTIDIRESNDEEFCRGEWRNVGDCDSGVNEGDDMDDDSESNGKGSDDDEEDDD